MSFEDKIRNLGYYKYEGEWYISESNGFLAIVHPCPSIVSAKAEWFEYTLLYDKIYQPNGTLLDLTILKRLKTNFRDFKFEDGYFIIEFGQEKIELKVYYEPTTTPYKIQIIYAELL